MSKTKATIAVLIAVFAVSAIASASASAFTSFMAEKYPGMVFAKNTKEGEFKIGSTKVNCKTAEFESGTISAATSELKMKAKYSGCTAFGFIGATVTMGTCEYNFHASGVVDIVPSGCGPIKIEAGECVVTVGSQTGLKEVVYTNSAPVKTVTVKANVKKVKYTLVKGGFGCPSNSTEEAVYTEEALAEGLEGTKPGEKPINILME